MLAVPVPRQCALVLRLDALDAAGVDRPASRALSMRARLPAARAPVASEVQGDCADVVASEE